MNTNTGRVYESLVKALDAGECLEELVTGPEPAIRRLSKIVMSRNKQNERRRARRKIAAESRRKNR